VHEVSDVTQRNPPGLEVTVYETAAPPSKSGANQDSVTEPSPTEPIATSETDEGTVDGTIGSDGAKDELSPDTFVAVTVNV
jgi:hypothetical protein